MISNWDHLCKYYLPFQADVFLASEQIKYAILYQSYEEVRLKLWVVHALMLLRVVYTRVEQTLSELGFLQTRILHLYLW